MNEQVWLTAGNLGMHVEFLWQRKQFRKLRLFSVACCRQLEPWIKHQLLFDALDRAELLADGRLSDATIGKWRLKIQRLADTERRGRTGSASSRADAVISVVRTACLEERYNGYTSCWRDLAFSGSWYSSKLTHPGPTLAHLLLLDIFGNPFRPVAFDPAWRTEHTVGLALRMYDDREFGPMPILADALEEAGCDNADILAHCREPGTHVRGCWVVDHLLDKS